MNHKKFNSIYFNYFRLLDENQVSSKGIREGKGQFKWDGWRKYNQVVALL